MNLKIKDVEISQERAILRFAYQKNNLYFIQGERKNPSSISATSDRGQVVEEIYNDWINQTIEIKENKLSNNGYEYEVEIYNDKTYYYLYGIIERSELIKIVENLNFF